MTDFLNALQHCSLISLSGSPQLLRQSIIQRETSHYLLWDSREARDVGAMQQAAALEAAGDKSGSITRPAAVNQVCMQEEQNHFNWLACSLPLITESPAITGKQPTRGRFRRNAQAIAAAASAAPPQKQQQEQLRPHLAAEPTGPPSLGNSSVVSSCTHTIVPLGSAGVHRQHYKDSGLAVAAATPNRKLVDLTALQVLLDDSNCSASSLLRLPAGRSPLPLNTGCGPAMSADAGPTARLSASEDVGVPADRALAQLPECSLAAETNSTESAKALPSVPQGWDNLLLLLSLDESVSLLQAAPRSFNLDTDSTSTLEAQKQQQLQACNNEPQELQDAEWHSSDATQEAMLSAAADSTAPMTPTLPILLRAAPSRSIQTSGSHTASCDDISPLHSSSWAFPSCDILGSPVVLLSSPIPGAAEAASCSNVHRARRTWKKPSQQQQQQRKLVYQRSSIDTDEQALRASSGSDGGLQLLQEVEAAEVDTALGSRHDAGTAGMCNNSNAVPDVVHRLSASGSSVQEHGLVLHQGFPNRIEHSPIRGVALWSDEFSSASRAADGVTGAASAAAADVFDRRGQVSPHQADEPLQCTLLDFSPQQHHQYAAASAHAASPASVSIGSPRFGWQQHNDASATKTSNSQSQASFQQPELVQQTRTPLLQQLLEDSCDSWQEMLHAVDSHGQATQQDEAPQPSSHLVPQTQGSDVAASPPCVSPCPAESVDSFVCAAAGEPYSSVHLRGRDSSFQECGSSWNVVNELGKPSNWATYEGVGALLTPGAAFTPATVTCKDGWGVAAAADGSVAATHADQEPRVKLFRTPAAHAGAAPSGVAQAAKAGHVAEEAYIESRTAAGEAASGLGDSAAGDFVLHRAGGDGTMSDLALLNPMAIQDLADRLAAAELRCAKHQQDVVKAQQVALQKDLELQLLRQALAASDQEGSSALEALVAVMDLAAVADLGSNSARNSMDGSSSGQAATAGSGDAVDAPASSQQQNDLEQLRQQNSALQQHSYALHSTMMEAAQQLDLLQEKMCQLSTEKETLQQQLKEAEQCFSERLLQQQDALTTAEQARQQQLADQRMFTQAELEEQQQQHEEEVRSLHSRLDDMQQQLSAAELHNKQLKQELSVSQQQYNSSQQQVASITQHCEQLQQQLDMASESLENGQADFAADVEQLRHQVAQLMASKLELQAANQALANAEAEYASAQMATKAKHQHMEQQLQDAVVANRQLQQAVEQLTTQNTSLSTQCQALKSAAEHTAPATAAAAAAHDVGPTPMRRRLAAVNAQLERRCQELLDQKQQLAVQLQQLHEQSQSAAEHQQQQESAAAAAVALQEQQLLLQELQDQVQQHSNCNEELLVQLEELDFEKQRLTEERDALLAHVADLNSGHERQVQSHMATLEAERATASACCKELEAQLADLQRQLQVAQTREMQAEQYSQLQSNNTALYKRCQELEALLQEAKQQLIQLQREQVQPNSGPLDPLQSSPSDLGHLAHFTQPAIGTATLSNSDVQASCASGPIATAGVLDHSDGALPNPQQHGQCACDAAVQVDLGPTCEQATAVQQLLLLQAQQQLQDMDEQNQQAAQRLLESKKNMADLQRSILQQEKQLMAAEGALAEAKQRHKQHTTTMQKQVAELQREISQLLQQLHTARADLHALQQANTCLEAANKQLHLQVEQQKQDACKVVADLEASQQHVQDLQQQSQADKLAAAAAAAELQHIRENTRMMLESKEQESAASMKDLQQQAQHQAAQQQAAAALNEQQLKDNLQQCRQQMAALLHEKDVLAVELQQTKVAVDYMEESVRRLGQHNAQLVQQLQEALSTASSTSQGSTKAVHDSKPTLQDAVPVAEPAPPVSPRTLQQIIAAATRVNAKNKKLKQQLQFMQSHVSSKSLG